METFSPTGADVHEELAPAQFLMLLRFAMQNNLAGLESFYDRLQPFSIAGFMEMAQQIQRHCSSVLQEACALSLTDVTTDNLEQQFQAFIATLAASL